MALTIVEFEVVRDYLGVAADATEVDQVSILHNAIDARIKVICRYQQYFTTNQLIERVVKG